MTCAKTRVRVTLTHPDGRSWTGENYCRNPQATCPRAPGEDYTKCRTVCGQVGHAERVALELAGSNAAGCTARVEGHTYYCMDCQHALYAAGVVALLAPATAGVQAVETPQQQRELEAARQRLENVPEHLRALLPGTPGVTTCGKCIDLAGCADGVCYRAWCAADERRSLGRAPQPGDAELLGRTQEELERNAGVTPTGGNDAPR